MSRRSAEHRGRRNADSSNFARLRFSSVRSLQNVDLDRLLIIDDRREGHRIAERDRRVSVDELNKKTAAGLKAKAKRQYVKQNNVFVAGENAALDRGLM